MNKKMYFRARPLVNLKLGKIHGKEEVLQLSFRTVHDVTRPAGFNTQPLRSLLHKA